MEVERSQLSDVLRRVVQVLKGREDLSRDNDYTYSTLKKSAFKDSVTVLSWV